MARNIRWQVPFYSLDGIDCHVDIYAEGWSGGITKLKGAAVPFEWQEDDDESLLTVIRYKTGYLRVIEESYGDLTDLFPLQPQDRYVRFYYGHTLMFTGFIQAQAFDNDWIECPRILELPVISPLGLTEGLKFTRRNLPDSVSKASLLAEIIDGLNADYDGVVSPQSDPFTITSRLISDFVPAPKDADGNDAMVQESYYRFLEGLCNLYGWIAHDTPTAIVFSQFDYDGLYTNGDRGSTSASLSSYMSVRGSAHSESMVMPLKEIEVDYDGEVVESASIPFAHTVLVSTDIRTTTCAAWLKAVTPEISGSQMLTSNSLAQNGSKPVNKGVMAACVGTLQEQKEGLLAYYGAWGTSTVLLRLRLWKWPNHRNNGLLKLSFDIVQASSIQELATSTKIPALTYTVQVDGQYHNIAEGVHSWTSTPQRFPIDNAGAAILQNVPSGICMEINIYAQPQTGTTVPDGDLVFIRDVKVETLPVALERYRVDKENNRIIKGCDGSFEDGSINMFFSYDKKNCNTILDSDQISFTPPAYPYLFQSQNRLRLKMRGALPAAAYTSKWLYWISGWKWRIIATGMNPVDDEYTIVIHHSNTID